MARSSFWKRVYTRIPLPIRQHPLGMMAMWGWTMLGASLLIPNFDEADPKAWPDLLWPASVSGVDEIIGKDILAAGMVVSGVMFMVAQMCIHHCRWAPLVRWNSMWLGGAVVVYLALSILLKVLQEPNEVAWWWPISLATWLVMLSLFVLGAVVAKTGRRTGGGYAG